MTTINGLPAHALLVHVVVVFIPLAAVLLVVMAFWPGARPRLSVFTAIVAGVALVSVPLTTEAGEWHEHLVTPSSLVRAHTRLGNTMLPWAIGLFVLAAAVAVREILRSHSRTTTSARTDHAGAAHAPVTGAQTTRGDGIGGRPVSVVIAVLALVVAAGSIFTVYKIGDSGARAAWTERFSEQANPPHRQPRPHMRHHTMATHFDRQTLRPRGNIHLESASHVCDTEDLEDPHPRSSEALFAHQNTHTAKIISDIGE
jgi:hypothetical protein